MIMKNGMMIGRVYVGLEYPNWKIEPYYGVFADYDPIVIEANGGKKYCVFEISHWFVKDKEDTRFVILGIEYHY